MREGAWPGGGRFVRVASWLLPVTTLLFLGLFAWRFADERLYADSGYYLARVINEGAFRIEHGRWVLALSQVLPLLGVGLGVPMGGLILLHSLNNVVWLGACMLFAGRVLRDRNAALILACVHLIGLTHGLFCPIFELYYGVDLLVLFLATLRAEHLSPRLREAVLALLLIIVAGSHLFGMVLLAGVLLLHRVWTDRRLTALLALVLFAQATLHAFTISDYEKDHLSFLMRLGDPQAITGVLGPVPLLNGLTYTLRHYPDVLGLVLFTVFVLFRDGRRGAAVFFLVLLAAMLFLSALKLPGLLHDRYREQVNFATTAWVFLVLGLRVLPVERWRALTLCLLIAASLFRMARAEWIAPWYVERTALIEAEVGRAHAHGLRKAIVPVPVFFGPPHHVIDLSWSTSVESLLLSAKAGPGATVSLITTQDMELPEVRAQLDRFIFRRWDILPPTWLDVRYFQAPTGRYVPLPAGDR